MQDPQTGEMLQINDQVAQEAEKKGFCVLSPNETVRLKDTDLKVCEFGKKHILLEFLSSGFARNFKLGERVNLKNGTFIVESYGARYLRLKGIPEVHNLSQDTIDEYRKLQVETLRKTP